MKKKAVCCIVTALLLCTVLATTAFAISSISGPASVTEGETIDITVSTTAKGFSGLVSVSGLRVIGTDGGFSTNERVVLLSDAEAASVTYTCRVTASDGERVSFEIKDAQESDSVQDTDVNVAPWTATVISGSEPNPPTTDPNPPSEEPTPSTEAPGPTNGETPTVSASPDNNGQNQGGGAAGAATNGSSSPSGSAGTKKMPKTADSSVNGWILFIVGAAGAGIAVIAGRQVLAQKRG